MLRHLGAAGCGLLICAGIVLAADPPQRQRELPRAGELKVGDAAADFKLKTTDGKSEVQLSSFKGKRPVVLVFGSYT